MDSAFGAAIAVVSLVLGAVLKSFFDIVTGRELARYGNQLQGNLEAIRADLDQLRFERQLPLTHVYERRMQAIETLYAAVRKFRAAAESYFGPLDADMPADRAGPHELPGLAEAVGRARAELLETLETCRLWLPEATLALVSQMDQHFLAAIVASAYRQDQKTKMSITLDGRDHVVDMEAFDRQWPDIRSQFVSVLNEIEMEFRRLVRTVLEEEPPGR